MPPSSLSGVARERPSPATHSRRRPVIGITTETLSVIEGIPTAVPTSDILNRAYATAIARAGGLPLTIPLLPDDLDVYPDLIRSLDGLLLPGGVDIGPGWYGQSPSPALGACDPARDVVELLLARHARDCDLPTLGIGRGMQLLAVAGGGSLCQDLLTLQPEVGQHLFAPPMYTRDHIAHEITVMPGTHLHAIVGPRALVNSLHHQAVASMPALVRVAAVAPDGTVEALEYVDATWMVGVQWHPEVLTHTPATKGLLAAFLDAAGRYQVASRG